MWLYHRVVYPKDADGMANDVDSDRTALALNPLDAVFPKDLFSDYLETATAVVVQCGGPKMSPRTSI